MDPITYSAEMTSSIPPARLFKAVILDHHLLPKVVPQANKSVEILEGDGGAGTIKKFPEYPFKSAKHRVEALDKDNFIYSYSVIESDALKEGIEKFTNEIKFEASPDGGSICKTTSSIYTKGDAKIPEGEIQGGRQRSLGLFKAVEAYLLANPDAYN
ncbi:major allergen Pru ar 1-like [Coffea eugenioides]|uniref:major allergen Pru ar 1-like n=1 Tax=Coffea eugenioides TaxID=49369 RepID=UPI000F60D50F|nr:major allergen Pru ar 1-like [Coffea eugenioides]